MAYPASPALQANGKVGEAFYNSGCQAVLYESRDSATFSDESSRQ